MHEKFRRGNGINRYNASGLGRKPDYATKTSTDGDLAAQQMLTVSRMAAVPAVLVGRLVSPSVVGWLAASRQKAAF